MTLKLRHPSLIGLNSPQADCGLCRDAVPISDFASHDSTGRTPVKIKDVNFHIELNGASHGTSNYWCMRDPQKNALVVRRGQPFRITIHLSRKFNKKDHITLVFHYKDLCKTSPELFEDYSVTAISQPKKVLALKSTYGNKTKIAIPLIARSSYSMTTTSKWDAMCDYVGEDLIYVLVQAADDCIVGRWLMSICVEHNGELFWFHQMRKTTIYVLFNSSCKGDEVYLEHEKDRVEYVDSNKGYIFTGSDQHIMVSHCSYGQFQAEVMELAIHILLTTDLEFDTPERSNATKIVLVIAHAVARTTKILKYGGKLARDPWPSAADVIHQFWKHKKPVVYNDHKTVVGVLISIYRSLGIPARPVTGYNLATGIFDRITFVPAKKTKKDKGDYSDSGYLSHREIPNLKDTKFLVPRLKVHQAWVEVLTERDDLGESYKGWQAISNFGPASVFAIRQCNIVKRFDSYEFCKMINSKCNYFTIKKTMATLVAQCQIEERIASQIFTKKPGKEKFGSLSLVDRYLTQPEHRIEAEKSGFLEERQVLMQSHMSTSPDIKRMHFVGDKMEGLDFHLTPIQNVMLGDPAVITVIAACSDHRIDWEALLSVDVYSVSTDGKLLKKVKQASLRMNKMIEGGSAKVVLPYSEYSGGIAIGGLFKVIAFAWASGTTDGFVAMNDFFVVSIPTPSIAIERESVTVSIDNTLPIKIKNAVVDVHELSFDSPNVLMKISKLKPDERWAETVDLNVSGKGMFTVIAKVTFQRITASQIKMFNTI